MGLKRQLRMVKILKDLNTGKARQKHVVRTSHRKKKLTADEREVYKSQQAEALMEARKTGKVTFKTLYGSDGRTNPPVLLVDGYNIIGTARRHLGLMDLGSADMEEFRGQLLNALTDFSHYRGVKVMLVYDAMGARSKEGTTVETTKQGVDVVWTGDSEADSFISSHVSALYDQGCPHVFVSTNDQDLQTTSRSNSAYVVSGRRLINEMRQADKECRELLLHVRERAQKNRRLASSLSGNTLESLEQLRQGGIGGKKVQSKKVAGSNLAEFQSKYRSKYG